MINTRHRLEEQIDQARRDLEELEYQIELGEIDAETAGILRTSYRQELDAATRDLAGLEDETPSPSSRSRMRMRAGAGILIASVALTIGLVGNLAQQREDDPLEGVAGAADVNLNDVSNETMEAVIESYRDDPAVADQLPLMEFRLAERYFTAQDYVKAFGHYENVITANPPQDVYASAMTRVGWLVWFLNDRTDIALQALDRALEVDPSNPETLYVKGQILWCGAGETAEALALFRQVLDSDGLDSQVVAQVEDDVTLAEAGGACGP